MESRAFLSFLPCFAFSFSASLASFSACRCSVFAALSTFLSLFVRSLLELFVGGEEITVVDFVVGMGATIAEEEGLLDVGSVGITGAEAAMSEL